MALEFGPERELPARYGVPLHVSDRTFVLALSTGTVGRTARGVNPQCRAKAAKFSENTTSRVFASWLFTRALGLSRSTTPVTPPKWRKALSIPANQESRRSSVKART